VQNILSLKGPVPCIPFGFIKRRRTAKVSPFFKQMAVTSEMVYEQNAFEDELRSRLSWKHAAAEQSDVEVNLSKRFKLEGRPEIDESYRYMSRDQDFRSWKRRRKTQYRPVYIDLQQDAAFVAHVL
jgi:hypothetical protein